MGWEVATTSKAETIACQLLGTALQGLNEGASVPDTEEFRGFLSALERILPEYLAEAYGFWRGESLDGVYPEVARMVGPHALEVIGLGLTLSDQSLMALHVRLGLRERADGIKWMVVRLGEETAEGLRRTPYSLDRLHKEMHATAQRIGEIDWAFAVQYGSPPAV